MNVGPTNAVAMHAQVEVDADGRSPGSDATFLSVYLITYSIVKIPLMEYFNIYISCDSCNGAFSLFWRGMKNETELDTP